MKVGEVELGFYEDDFDYEELPANVLVVEDCKGYVKDKGGGKPVSYRLFLLKKGLMLALYGITVVEVFRR